MTIKTRELIEAVSVVAENHNIQVTIKSSVRATAIVAGTTFVGAVVRICHVAKSVKHLNKSLFLQLMGPIGILVGSTGGGIYSYLNSKGL